MSRAAKNEKKLAVLEVIKSKKDILFGTPKNNLETKTQKEEAWNEVLTTAKCLGVASANRKWKFARDNIFGLWKSRTLAKRENCKNRSVVLDVVDEAILDIIGPDAQHVKQQFLPKAAGNGIGTPHLGQNQRRTAATFCKHPASRMRVSDVQDAEMLALKKQLLKVEIYKAQLEALKLERELEVPCSEFTRTLNEMK